MGLRYARYQDNGQLTIIRAEGDCVAGRLRPSGRSKGKNAARFHDPGGKQIVLRNQPKPKEPFNAVIKPQPKPKPQPGRILSAKEFAEKKAKQKGDTQP
jgi:hypothetical protein